jgi:signal transduction histidine kinase
VTNTGPTIPPDEIERLFQPFQRLDRARTHLRGGHGLGLSIVRAIATAHDATISAEPVPGGGLSVGVTFPAAPGDDTARLSGHELPAVATAGRGAPKS